jgi:hypothetical protein
MLEITIKEKEGTDWIDCEVPDALTEKIITMKTYAGKEAVIQIKTDKMVTFLCGTQNMVNVMRKAHPHGKVIMGIEDAYNMVQYAPDVLLTTIQCFWTPAQIATVFPEKPVVDKKGWEHLKPNE